MPFLMILVYVLKVYHIEWQSLVQVTVKIEKNNLQYKTMFILCVITSFTCVEISLHSVREM